MSFRSRLTLFFLLIVVLPMVAVAVLVVQVTGASRTGKADARLASSLEAALALYESDLEDAQLAAREAARDPALAEALRSGDTGAVAEDARRLARSTGIESLAVIGRGGEEIASVGPRETIAEAEVRQGGPGGSGATLIVSTTTPTAYVDRVEELTGRRAAVIQGGAPIATTIPLSGAEVPDGREAETVDVGGEELRAASAELAESGPGPTRLTLFGPIEAGGFAAARPLVAAALVVFFAIALLFILMLLRTLQGQVSAMFDAARRIGAGDFSREVPVEGSDEMAGLASEFNKMSDRLSAQMDELRRQRREIDESVRRIGEAFASGLDRRALLEVIAEAVLSACGAERARIRLASTGEEVDVGRSADPAAAKALGGAEAEASERDRMAEATHDGASALAHPLVRLGGGGHSMGLMGIVRGGDRPFTAEEREVLRYLIGQASVSIENVGLHELVAEQAVTDELTGLSNHRHFRDWIGTEFARANRFKHELSLLMLDIDDFKQINDTHGHLQGDEVLRTIGEILRRESREIDEPARYGGEEFALGLPETGLEGALEVAERIRSRIERAGVRGVAGEGTIRVTASVGVASIPSSASDVTGLIAAADEALYRAKRDGKNRAERSPAAVAS